MEGVSKENSDSENICTPPDMRECAENINAQLLPEKSREKYEATYLTYKKWQISKNVKITSENVLMVYFKELSEKYKPSTLWSTWSIIKTTVNQKEGIDINQFKQLKAFLKRQSDGYKCKKLKVLSPEEVEKFLKEAPDHKYLAVKVALIFGISGACRREELANIKLKDVQHQGEILVVKIPDTKTKIPRTFTIEGEFCKLVETYVSLRPLKASSDRFFLNYQMGKCTVQVIGKNKFGIMPKQIAEYLNLPDPSLYTGHSFRRTSATLLTNSGADLLTLKRHGGWENSTVAEGYVEDSINNKRKKQLDQPNKSDAEPQCKIEVEDYDFSATAQLSLKNEHEDQVQQFADYENMLPVKKEPEEYNSSASVSHSGQNEELGLSDNKPGNAAESTKSDEFDIFGQSVASQLKALPLEQAILARDEIQTLLTEYRFRSLSKDPLINN